MTAPGRVAAFFDLDGTLLPAPSLEWRFISYLLWRDKLSTTNIMRWLLHTARSIPRGPRRAMESNKRYLAGLRASLVGDWMDSLYTCGSNAEPFDVFEEGLNRIRWHQSQYHQVFLVSGTLAPLAACVAGFLPGSVESIATELVVSVDDRTDPDHPAQIVERDCHHVHAKNLPSVLWTGRLAGEHIVGTAKRRALQEIAKQQNFDLHHCYAYGNSTADCAMLGAVGNPEAVNATPGLTRIAQKRGWPLSNWAPVRSSPNEMYSRTKISTPLAQVATTERSR